MELCFGFVLNTGLIIQRWFCYSWQCPHSQGLFAPTYCHAGEEVGSAWQAGRRHSQDRGPKMIKGVFQTLWHHAQYMKWGQGREEKRRERPFEYDICLPKSLLCVMGPCNTCLPLEEANSFFIFLGLCVCGFCFSYYPVSISTHKFFSFYPANSLPDAVGGGVSEQQTCKGSDGACEKADSFAKKWILVIFVYLRRFCWNFYQIY